MVHHEVSVAGLKLVRWLAFLGWPRALLPLLFLLTLPIVTPYLRGDGVGYYAYVASFVIDHDLQFENQYRHADPWHYRIYFDDEGKVRPHLWTPTGHLENKYSVGPSLFWLPFFLLAHLSVALYNALPWSAQPILADGFSWPYLYLCALGTACLGFVGLLLSYMTAQTIATRWAAFWAVLGIWAASGLPVYMYFLPFMSHAHSAFIAALFVWFWWYTYPKSSEATPTLRSVRAWFTLGILAGLLFTTYYVNAILWVFVLADMIAMLQTWHHQRTRWSMRVCWALRTCLPLAAGLVLGVAPFMLVKAQIYASPWELGYGETWYWSSPRLLRVLFSAEHGLWSWTPVVFLACLGFIALLRSHPPLGWRALLTFLLFWYVIASFQNWHGQSSFSSRFFVSLTPLFVLGLAAFLEDMARRLQSYLINHHPVVRPTLVFGLILLMLWNVGFIFQWGSKLVPNRGPVSFAQVARNQFTAVPVRLSMLATRFFSQRQTVIKEIEREDMEEARHYRIRR